MKGQTSRQAESLVAGRRAVAELLRSGRPVHRLYVAEGATGLEALVAQARQAGVPVQRVPRAWLSQRCPHVAHQGVAAVAAAAAYRDLDELLARVEQEQGPVRVLVLDHIQDPQNLGSLLRSADGLGAIGVVIPARRAAGLTEAAWKASAGAAAHVPVARTASVAEALRRLKRAGLWAVGADPGAGQVLWEVELPPRLALVVGAEGAGLSALVRERCDLLVRIPLQGKVESLNAGVAGALLLYEAIRQQAVASRSGQEDGRRGSVRAQERGKSRYDGFS